MPGATHALSIATLTAALAAPLAFAMPAAQDLEVAAIFPPWWTQQAAFAAAASAGAPLAPGNAPFVVVVRVTEPASRQRLHAAGALFLIHPQAVGVCRRRQEPTRV